MAINFVPKAGHVLMCDFRDFKPPEMTKVRHVIVISPRERRFFPGTYIVVPVSMTPPAPAAPHHVEFKCGSYGFFDPRQSVWALGDMVTSVAYHRLERLKV